MKSFRYLFLILFVTYLAGVSTPAQTTYANIPSVSLLRVKHKPHRARHHKAHSAKHHHAHPAKT